MSKSITAAIVINETEVQPIVVRDQRVLTLAMIDKIHGRPEGTARRNFRENKARLIEGEDFIVVTRESPMDEIRSLENIPPKGVSLLTESGYLLLVKSFTDDLAWRIQKRLVQAYFRAGSSNVIADTVLNTTIGTDGFRCLAAVVDGKVRALPVPARRRAKAKLWAQVHGAFSVRSAEDIPADQLDAARNFVAAYALEGEWLPKVPQGDFVISRENALDLCHLLHHAEWCVHRWNEDISKGLMELNRPLWSRTHEHFQEVERTGKGLERSMSEMIGHFRSRLGGLRPGETVGRGLSV